MGDLPFPLEAGRIAPEKKSDEKEKGYSAINVVVTRHSQTHPWSLFQEACPSGTHRDPEIFHERGGD